MPRRAWKRSAVSGESGRQQRAIVYGSGGGGAQYPDQVFFNLKGKTLYIVFDGPYDGRSPTRETEQIESEMLASFRTF